MATRVVLFAHIKLGEEERFEEAFAEVRRRVAGVEGHHSDELLRDEAQPGDYVLMSEWDSKEAFLKWQEAPVHMEMTEPMQPYFARPSEMKFYEVALGLEAHA